MPNLLRLRMKYGGKNSGYLINIVHCDCRVLSFKNENNRSVYMKYNLLPNKIGNFVVRQLPIDTYLQFYQFDKISFEAQLYSLTRKVFGLWHLSIEHFPPSMGD